MQTTDLINALKSQLVTAQGCTSDFAKGYQMALAHAIELAEVMQFRIDLGLAQEKGQN